MARAIAAVSRRLSNENRRDLRTTPSMLAADGSLRPAADLVVVSDDIWDICQAPLSARLHRDLTGEKALADLCSPVDLDVWVRTTADRARDGSIKEDERQALYAHLLSADVALSRSALAAVRQSPVLRDRNNAWTAAEDMVRFPAALAQLLGPAIHAPAPALAKRSKLLTSLRLREKLTGEDLVSFAIHLIDEPQKAEGFEALLKANPQLLKTPVLTRLGNIPCLRTRSGGLAAPQALFLDNAVNRICVGGEHRLAASRSTALLTLLGCQERPSVAVMLQAISELNAEGQPPSDIEAFYAVLVQAVRAERTSIPALADHPILWFRDAYHQPKDVLVGGRIPPWFQRATPHVRGPAGLVEYFEALGAASLPQDHHWLRFFQWVGSRVDASTTADAELRLVLQDAYKRRGFAGLPPGLPDDSRCLLRRDFRLFSVNHIRAGAFVEDDFPALADAFRQAGAAIGFAATAEDTRNFFSVLNLARLTSVSGTPSISIGAEAKPSPWFKPIHAERILGRLKRPDFRTSIDLLIYGYHQDHPSFPSLPQQTVLNRLGALERIRFVTGIDRQYTVGDTTVPVTTDAAAINGEIVLKPTRTKFDFEQNLTFALAELLGATQVTDARRLSTFLLPLLMCDSGADMFAYLERQGLKPPAWIDSTAMVEEPEEETEPPLSPQRSILHSMVEDMFRDAEEAGPDPSPPPAAAPAPSEAAPVIPPIAGRPRFELPPLDQVVPHVLAPSGHALAAKPALPGGWSSGGYSNWRAPDAYDVDRDQKVGARGEEIVYRAELERVRQLGYKLASPPRRGG